MSNPVRPDNERQTILQTSSAADRIIEKELALPNIFFGGLSHLARPVAAPRLRATLAARAQEPQAVEGSTLAEIPRHMAILLQETTVTPARFPIPLRAKPAAPPTSSLKDISEVGAAKQAAADAADALLVVGLNPAPPGGPLALPPGNRFGAFSIAPGSKRPGSPDGVSGYGPQGGSGGMGVGSSGEGGPGEGSSSPTRIAGTLEIGSDEVEPLLSSGAPVTSLLIPLATAPRLKAPGFLVSSGAVGGAGLGIYGVLHCGEIYTVNLPAPGKYWILEYCALGSPAPQSVAVSGHLVMQPEKRLVAPAIEERCDFRRPPVPAPDAGKVIILRGRIDEEGRVGALSVYQGAAPDADLAARAAFARWKFKPALREGKPVRVEILVGIPVGVPQQK